MYCRSCGHQNPPHNNFCSECGNPLDDNFTTAVAKATPPAHPTVNIEPADRKRKTRLYIIGLLAALAFVALFGVADYFYFRAQDLAEEMAHKAAPPQSPAPAQAPIASPASAPTPKPSVRQTPVKELPYEVRVKGEPLPEPTGTPITPRSEPKPRPDAQEPAPSPAPQPARLPDPEKALPELMVVEEQMHRALVNGDRELLDKCLAEEFVNIAPSGNSSTKAQYLTFAGRSSLKAYSFANQRIVGVNKDTVMMSLIKKYYYTHGTNFSSDTDAFIWRDGRWQMLYSHSARREASRANPNQQTSTLRPFRPNGYVRVWVTTVSGLYHCPESKFYGLTQDGMYLFQRDAINKGYRPAQDIYCR